MKTFSIKKLLHKKYFVTGVTIEDMSGVKPESKYYGKYHVIVHKRGWWYIIGFNDYKNNSYAISDANKFIKILNKFDSYPVIRTYYYGIHKKIRVFIQYHIPNKIITFTLGDFFIYWIVLNLILYFKAK